MNRRWAWALIPYAILPPSLIHHTVSVDVIKAPRKKKSVCVRAQDQCQQGGGPRLPFPYPIIPLSLIHHIVFVDVIKAPRKKSLYKTFNKPKGNLH